MFQDDERYCKVNISFFSFSFSTVKNSIARVERLSLPLSPSSSPCNSDIIADICSSLCLVRSRKALCELRFWTLRRWIELESATALIRKLPYLDSILFNRLLTNHFLHIIRTKLYSEQRGILQSRSSSLICVLVLCRWATSRCWCFLTVQCKTYCWWLKFFIEWQLFPGNLFDLECTYRSAS